MQTKMSIVNTPRKHPNPRKKYGLAGIGFKFNNFLTGFGLTDGR